MSLPPARTADSVEPKIVPPISTINESCLMVNEEAAILVVVV